MMIDVTRRFTILLLMMTLIATACGGDDDVDGIATLESTTTEASAAQQPASSSEISEEQALELSQCMRDQGLEFPDPTMDAEGNLTMDDLDMSVFGSTPEEIRTTLESALDACSEYLEGVTFGGGQLPDLVELQDTFLEFSTCMRENGYDMPDPDFSDGGIGGFFEMGDTIDPDDPTFQAALAECQSIFTQLER
jgi:hypothetical protein